MAELLENASLRDRMSGAAREYAGRHWSVDATVGTWAGLYEELAMRPG
jgi:hypothetical protein